MTNTLTGGCLCGAFRFELSGDIDVFNLCFCSRCRKRTGSGFAAIVHGAFSDFKILRCDALKRFEPEEWNTRQFCGNCGSPLPGRDESDNHVGIPAGLFDALPNLPELQIMTGSKADWFEPITSIPSYEVFPKDW